MESSPPDPSPAPPESSGSAAVEPDPDALIMARAADGDDAAFAELVERHQRALLNYFVRSGATHDSEDLVQETFVRLYRYRDRYQPIARFTTFLYHLARHVWIDRTRKVGRAFRLSDALREEERHRSDPGSSAPAEAALDAATALDTLSPKLREVVVLHIYQGLRYHEIASVLGIPEGTVKSRMNLAMTALRNALHEND